MGGVVENGVGINTKTSPRLAAIEKAQAELRQEYDVRAERRRELEFLEKGGNPLDFKFGSAASISVQSTSLTDQPPEQIVTSEAKGSFALTASPRGGDSVESSGRPGAPTVSEPNCADNLLLLDGESEFVEAERNSVQPSRANIVLSKQSSQLDKSQNAKGSGDSAAFGLPNRAYKRRNRSRPNRDGARSGSADVVPSRGGYGSSLPSRHVLKVVKRSVLDMQKDQNVSSNCNSMPTSPSSNVAVKVVPSDGQVDRVLDNVQATEPTSGLAKLCQPEPLPDFNASKSFQDNQHQSAQIDAQEKSAVGCEGADSVYGRDDVASVRLPLSIPIEGAENQTSCGQLNGFSTSRGDKKITPNEVQNSSAAFSTKGLESESSCTQTSFSLDGNNDSHPPNNVRNVDSDGNDKEQTLEAVGTPNIEGDEMIKEKNEKKADGHYPSTNAEPSTSIHQSHQSNSCISRTGEELRGSGSGSLNEVKSLTKIKGMEGDGINASDMERNPGHLLVDNLNPKNGSDCAGRLRSPMESSAHYNLNPQEENSCARLQDSMGPSMPVLGETTLSVRGSADAPEQQTCFETDSSLANREREDSILEEAQIIEAKRKRIAELSVVTLPSDDHRKFHWDFVLEEMAWLANDFVQERLWKITAAAEVCHQIASTSQFRFEEQNLCRKQKKVAHTLAKAIMEFWHSAEELSKVGLQCPGRNFSYAVQGYAVRFLKYNSSLMPLSLSLVEALATPDRISDFGIQEVSRDEEILFYTVPPGAMEKYRKSMESHLVHVEKTGSSIQQEGDTSMYDVVTDYGSQEHVLEEDEGETSTYNFCGGYEGSKPSKSAQKKKNLPKSSAVRSINLGALCMEDKVGIRQSISMGKRPANSLTVGLIPTKRIRTPSRQRALVPFNSGTSGGFLSPIKTDASSDDTNSFQDDQSTLRGGCQIPNSLEVESLGNFEKQIPFDSAEVSKPKKKKKAKHLEASTYEQRWQLDNNFQTELRDHPKNRLDTCQLESNGSNGLFGQHIMKKPKLRQSVDSSFDNLTPTAGSIPSPVASQMSNMSNPNKFIKILGGRDRGRKVKSPKMPTGQPGLGSLWSVFEDQALVVLVHDLGPHWELVSDAINSTFQLKCIFRKPTECKERHKILMDGTPGDGADSAENSGSCQTYPSTLPGIPKGSARQLFQRLQGPIEEDMIKSHFEKIIMISQKQHCRRRQNDNQDSKPIQPHNSHVHALSQVCPNNLNGGHPLTPLDLCDTTAPSPDVLSHGCQTPHASGLGISNQGTVASVLPASTANSSLQGPSNMGIGNNFLAPSAPHNSSVRYGASRSASLPTDEQQRVQQYNQMLSGRNIQAPCLPLSGASPGSERGVRMRPSGNGMGIMSGMNRSMPMARPGCQGIAPSPMLNSGSVLSSSMGTVLSPVSTHSVAGGGQGNSVLRPRDSLNMMRPGQNPEHQRQIVVPEHHMQVTQGNNQGVSAYGGLSSAFSNQTSSPPVQTYPQHQMVPKQSHVLNNHHHPHPHPHPHPHLQGPNHASSPQQQQAYAFRFAKERQLQQRLLQQQQQQFASSSVPMAHVQSQPQLPTSSSLQSSSQVQPQTSGPALVPVTQSSSSIPMSQHQETLHMPPQVLNRNSQTGGNGLINQIGKQRQRQPQQAFQQTGRHHLQQRQQPQTQQPAKLVRGVGRGNMLMHQNLTMDPSLLNGLSTASGGQSAEKADQVMHLMQSQGVHPGPGLNPIQASKPLMPPHSSNQPSHSQQNMYSGQAITSSKHVQQMPSHSDVPAGSGHTIPGSQPVPPSVMGSSNLQQLQAQQKSVNQTLPTVQRVVQQNRLLNSDPPSKSQANQAQADPQAVSSSFQMGTTMAIPQSSGSTITVRPAVSSSGTPWKAPEQMYDSGMLNPAVQLAPTGSPASANSAGSEPIPTVSQGLGQGQSSGSLAPGGAQWQQLQQSQQQLPPQRLQAGNSSLYIIPANSKLE
ncbi:chromatin modification-related protein EAF1 B-like isoform X2 [Diospyros lotus]|uniref:chromatin modification-related protein EAF1 B-like isoform X2 n=1 Tax=Diospyros lotus TaxID=55363 RepID=UPI00224F1B16|nr:chromatin modification-related protein EAF1 B-like isoform X2 [Diospyros lotus]